MASASTEPLPATRRRVRRALPVLVVVVACVVVVLGYVRIGWDRMVTACTSDSPRHHPTSSVEFGWSWSPPGFTCTYGDGTAETSLWF
ncbi:MAG TPA: hypothetical protein VFT75_00595 [Nocardioidaceae bacterium]|jgi:hypothetical protein|nr:hypothetical protein [Nocardioidaceae bacterium]